jgi:hypothetical protein
LSDAAVAEVEHVVSADAGDSSVWMRVPSACQGMLAIAAIYRSMSQLLCSTRHLLLLNISDGWNETANREPSTPPVA